MSQGVLGAAVGDYVLDLEIAPPEMVAEEVGARIVFVAGRVDRWNPDEIRRELDDFVRGAINLAKDQVRGTHQSVLE
jgi:hypothetical protein